MTQEEKLKMLEAIGKSGVFVAGDVVMEKNVQYEIGNVEAGGVGIQLVNGKETTKEKQEKTPKNKGGRPGRKGKTITKSFIYDAGNETNVRLQMLYSGLLYLGWIREDTDFRTFLSIFSGHETTCRIVWTGDMNTLAELFRQLVEVNKWVKLPEKESIWIMVNARFWNKEGNKEFGNTNLGATKAPVESKDSISLLVSIMNPENPIKELKKIVQNL